jgi:hypothetical protein
MTRIELREHVRRSVSAGWDEFTREHPLLARVVDQDLLVEHAMTRIADDPGYQSAMDQSAAVGIGMTAIESFVKRFVARLLEHLD